MVEHDPCPFLASSISICSYLHSSLQERCVPSIHEDDSATPNGLLKRKTNIQDMELMVFKSGILKPGNPFLEEDTEKEDRSLETTPPLVTKRSL